MANHQEYLSSDFSEILKLACQINPPKDFILPNMYLYAKDKRREYGMRMTGRLTEEDKEAEDASKKTKKHRLKEKLERNAKQKDIKWIK